MLKLIQLGLTLTDGEGNLPMIGNHYCMWQFNFREFSLKEDMYAQDSIALLKHSGIDFKAHEERGIDVHRFGELLMVSGVVLSSKVKWVTFHSGYDFGYLVKLLTCRPLPTTEAEFFHIRAVFPERVRHEVHDEIQGRVPRRAEQARRTAGRRAHWPATPGGERQPAHGVHVFQTHADALLWRARLEKVPRRVVRSRCGR